MAAGKKQTVFDESDFVEAVRVRDGAKVNVPKSWLAKGSAYADHYRPVQAPPEPVEIPEGDPTETWKGDQLKAYAAQHEISLAGATSKADIVAAIAAAREAAAGGQGQPS